MKKFTKILVALLAVACIPTTLAACDIFGTPSASSSSVEVPDSSSSEAPAAEKVVLDKTTASMDLYETMTLTATLENVTGDIVWSTSDTSKATVVDGVVTALAEGEVTITATVGEFSAQCVITIESSGQMPVLSVNSDNVSLMEGQEFTLTSVLNFKGQALNATFTYATSDPSIATVENGKIKAVATGSTTIIVSVEYNGFEDSKVVAVKVTEDVLLEASESEIVLGTLALNEYVTSKTVTTTVTVSGVAVENAQVVWAVENDAVATVDGGVITAVGAGETNVSATYTSEKGNAFTVYVKVIVEKPIVAEELEDNLIDIDADDNDTVELKVNSDGLVQILDKSNDNAALSYTLVDGKVMLNKSDLSVSKRTLLIEYTDVIYEVVVFITTERVTLISFATETDLENVGFYWDGPQTMALDTEVVAEGDTGSLKITYTQEQGWNYLLLKTPLVTDISLYDFIEFKVYNPTNNAFVIQPTWGTGVTVAANGWTDVRFLLTEFADGKITDMAGKPITAGNITNLPLCFYGDGFVADQAFYISSIEAGKFERVVEEVAENVVAKFTAEADLTSVTSFWAHVYGLSIDTTFAYGEEKGSLKATVGTPNGNGYLILNDPLRADVSAYDYISFWVYNAGSADVNIGTLWNATPAKAGEWTQFKFSAEVLNSVEDMNGTKLSTSNITNFVIWITGGDALVAGDALYFSTITAGKNSVVEEEIPENVVAKFESEADLSSVESYWPTVYALSVDTEMKHGEEKGSLKATVGELNANGYISVKNPINKNVSAYDYVSFWVYNGGTVDIEVGTLWKGFAVKAGEWTEIKLTADILNGADTMFGTKVSMEDLTNMVIWIIGGDKLTVGDALYFSSLTAGKNPVAEEVAENVVAKFESEADLDTVWSYWEQHTLSIDTNIKHGEDAGSLKVTYKTQTGNSYVVLANPVKTDVSAYDYISFWVYNDSSDTAIKVATLWGGYDVPKGVWTEIRISAAEINGTTDMNSVALSTSNISNFVFFISWADDIQVGESIYISSVTAGVNGVAKNVITNFKDNSSLSQVSVFWADACTASIDTTIKHEGEEASLKYTYNQEQNFNYIILNAPLNADVSAYDYIAFYVYNPTEHAFMIQPTWGEGVDVAANGWTLVKIDLAQFDAEKITDMSGAVVTKANIVNLPLCIYGTGFVAGESIYFSSFIAGNNAA